MTQWLFPVCDIFLHLLHQIQNIEISQKEFDILQRNVHELQLQIRDMEDIEVHRDELIEKLQHVKKQRDDFLTKGRLVEEERNEFVRSNKTLEQYLADWKKKTVEFKRTNLALKERVSRTNIPSQNSSFVYIFSMLLLRTPRLLSKHR